MFLTSASTVLGYRNTASVVSFLILQFEPASWPLSCGSAPHSPSLILDPSFFSHKTFEHEPILYGRRDELIFALCCSRRLVCKRNHCAFSFSGPALLHFLHSRADLHSASQTSPFPAASPVLT